MKRLNENYEFLLTQMNAVCNQDPDASGGPLRRCSELTIQTPLVALLKKMLIDAGRTDVVVTTGREQNLVLKNTKYSEVASDISVIENNEVLLKVECKTYMDNTMNEAFLRRKSRTTRSKSKRLSDTKVIAVCGQWGNKDKCIEGVHYIYNSKKRNARKHYDILNFNPLVEKDKFEVLYADLRKFLKITK